MCLVHRLKKVMWSNLFSGLTSHVFHSISGIANKNHQLQMEKWRRTLVTFSCRLSSKQSLKFRHSRELMYIFCRLLDCVFYVLFNNELEEWTRIISYRHSCDMNASSGMLHEDCKDSRMLYTAVGGDSIVKPL
jgi:hypothetical protein